VRFDERILDGLAVARVGQLELIAVMRGTARHADDHEKYAVHVSDVRTIFIRRTVVKRTSPSRFAAVIHNCE
jgi:hypothetical protein